MKYRKKPVVVEAIQFKGDIEEVRKFIGGDAGDWFVHPEGQVSIHTLEGIMRVDVNDYIIKGVNGEFYPCKPNIFEKTYEAVKGS